MTVSTIEIERRRPWRRLHASTYVVLLVAAAVLFLLNVPGERIHEFGLYPYESWKDRLQEERDEILIYSGIGQTIKVKHFLVHGWPKTWLVRDDDALDTYIDPETGEPRPTRIWSFNEELLEFYQGWLVVNILVALALTAVVGILFERWRRRRRHIWQVTVLDLLVLTALAAAVTAFGFKTASDYKKERAAFSAIGHLVHESDELDEWDLFGPNTRTQGGPSWLVELLGNRFPRWFDRAIQLEIAAEELEHLASFPRLRALRIDRVRLGDDRLSVLSSLTRLELLNLEREESSSGDVKGEDGIHDDSAVAHVLRYLEGLHRLEVLKLDVGAFGDESARAVSILPKLRLLIANDARFLSEDGLEAIGQCGRLEVLDINDCELSEAGTRFLGSLQRLRVLRFGDLTDDAVDELAALSALEELSCNGRKMSGRGIERFAELPQLRRLTLEDTWHHSAVERLEATRPDLKISVTYNVPAVKQE